MAEIDSPILSAISDSQEGAVGSFLSSARSLVGQGQAYAADTMFRRALALLPHDSALMHAAMADQASNLQNLAKMQPVSRPTRTSLVQALTPGHVSTRDFIRIGSFNVHSFLNSNFGNSLYDVQVRQVYLRFQIEFADSV